MPREYQLYFTRPDGEVALTLFQAADSDGEARIEAGRQLADHDSCDGVDVREGERLVARVRPDRPTPPAGSPLHRA